jgi:16S rRNA (adenine1518-N6/adenine1519-N6)-dimethyltransferase
MLRYCADIRRIASVKSHLFFPVPKIDSTVVNIRFKNILPDIADDESFLSRVVQAAFSKRRKTLKNALASSSLGISDALAVNALKASSIDPSRRAETLSVTEFVSLSNVLREIVKNESLEATHSL